MIIQPRVKGFLCTTAHPIGCQKDVELQIEHVRSQGPLENGPKRVLVIGASGGYGLASRITAAFGAGASTIGVFFERPATGKRTASPGWYKSAAFTRIAEQEGLYAKNLNGDAFSGEAFEGGTIDINSGELRSIALEPATEEEIRDTVRVMGGEDWELWIEALQQADVLAPNCITTNYTYLGSEVTWPIYYHGTIGKAKEDLDRAAQALHEPMSKVDGDAYVAVMKGLMTQAASAIPGMAIYLSLLFKIMKEKGTHEGCVEQTTRLFYTQLFAGGKMRLDDAGRIRMDELELDEDIQAWVKENWSKVTNENLDEITDFAGYREAFLQMHGFGFDGVDYDADVEHEVDMSLVNEG
jgi:enoyl-[acyl-carrier protein] reductase/trans-2-enoyl-CoA reductase (NAD+)